MAAAQCWRVVGGSGSGGVLVREGRGTASPEASSRLATGSVVRERALERGRLHYELLAGGGPQTGWVTTRLGGRDLLVPATAEEAEACTSRRGVAAASRRRIAAAGCWYEVLGVGPAASAEEVRRAFRELALLHHPDKRGAEAPDEAGSEEAAGAGEEDAGEAFRCVQRAYEEGLAEAARRAPAAGAVRAGGEVVAATAGALYPVAINAPRQQLHAACEDFEEKVDQGTSKSVPDDVPYVDVEQVARWLLEGRCVPIDAREPGEFFGANAVRMPGAVQLGYTRLLKSPETVTVELARLKNYADAGLRFVAYSTHGSPSNGNHAIVCCLLVDVFGFDLESMSCLEDGFLMWRQWASKNPGVLDKIRSKYGAT